ncbi:hypothetical protein ACWDBD_15380 [Streptomyces sp. NPDC001118]
MPAPWAEALWLTHDAADRWAIAIAFAVAASGAVDKALSPWAGHAPSPSGPSPGPGDGRSAASGTTPPDADPPGPPPEPSGGRRTRTRGRVTTALVSAAVTAALVGVAYGLLAPKAGHSGPASSATTPTTSTASQTTPPPGGGSTPDGYTLVYGHRTLSLKNDNYYFDLRAGAVSGSETAWSLSTNAGGDSKGAFELQPLTDVYVAPGKAAPSAGLCAANHHRCRLRQLGHHGRHHLLPPPELTDHARTRHCRSGPSRSWLPSVLAPAQARPAMTTARPSVTTITGPIASSSCAAVKAALRPRIAARLAEADQRAAGDTRRCRGDSGRLSRDQSR